MTQLIIRLFIPNWKNTENPAVRERYGKVSGLVGVATNLLLAVLKLVTGLLFNSIAIMADAANNFSDSASSVVTLIGFKLSGKPADAEHPFGHARIEYISGMIVSFIVVMLGFQLAQSSIEKILVPEEASFTWVTVAILMISILAKLWQGLFYRKMGKTISSTTLMATATDSINDVVATSAVLLGILITLFTKVNLDGWLGLAVAVFIMISGVRLIMETSQPLLGTAPSKELVDSVYTKILSYDGIIGLHDLEVHSYGEGRVFASVHCEVDAEQDIMISHDIIDNIERELKKELHCDAVIHMDPVMNDDEETQTLKETVTGLLHQLDSSLNLHDFRIVKGPTHTNIIFDILVPYTEAMPDEEILSRMEEAIHKLDSRYYAVINIDKDYNS